MVGERLRQGHVVLVEHTAGGVPDAQRADHSAARHERHCEHRAVFRPLDTLAQLRREPDPPVVEHVQRGDRGALLHGEACRHVSAWKDEVVEGGRGAPGMTDAGKRILLVEDDRFLRRACESSLRQRGFTVISAVDGEEGLRRAQRDLPDLVLLDLLMPRLPGVDVLRALKADPATRHIPVLVLSNSSRDQDVAEVMALGALDYWVKASLSLKELGERVARLLAD